MEKGQIGAIFHLEEELSWSHTTYLQEKEGDVLGLVVQLLLPTSRSALRRAHVAPGQRRDGFLRAIFTVYNHKTNSPKMPQTK